MHQPRPDTKSILDGLKDFQRDTVEYVFRRLYVDQPPARRFLVADEVGLGKTLVARGVIAKTLDHLWDHTRRIDIIYVCSNTDIARQNIHRLNVTGSDDFSLSSRITLLPITVGDLASRKVNFISFTPGTSFDLKDSAGTTLERELLYWMLQESWSLNFSKATRVLHAYAKIDGFRSRVQRFPEDYDVHPQMREDFCASLASRSDLKAAWDSICEAMPRAGYDVPLEVGRQRNLLIGDLRRLLAETCLRWLEPDLIILDEFQRFKHLLEGTSDNASEAAQLAEHLFSFQQSSTDASTAARVLLLSATPYKMYTQSQESAEDNHYQDFQTTLDFLLHETQQQTCFHERLKMYREELYRLAQAEPTKLVEIKTQLEESLKCVMVRTERLALKADRNGMLVERPAAAVSLKSSDVCQYLALQKVAEHLGHDDVLEYWKSSPYLLNFMEEYDLKRRLKQAVEAGSDAELAHLVRSVSSGLLDRSELERYRRLDPANARLRSLYHDTVGQAAWQLLWIPPSLPYYEGTGPFSDPALKDFTKRLVFSSWRVVPKAIASVLSYEAERSMMQRFRRKAQNTSAARKRRRALLRFTFSKGRATGMTALAMLYPSRFLAKRFDPLILRQELSEAGEVATLDRVVQQCELQLEPMLRTIYDTHCGSDEKTDDDWYWAAPLLLEQAFGGHDDGDWVRRPELPNVWRGDSASDEPGGAVGWTRHVRIAQERLESRRQLGRPPQDLARVVAWMALAAPGVVSLRALERIVPSSSSGECDVRDEAGALAHGFLHLFNLPEVMYLLRDRQKVVPYWKSVLEYCLAGNLQAVMDEYAHVLVESLGLIGSSGPRIAAEVRRAISDALTIRTSTAKADIVTATRRSVSMDESEAVRMRNRFAMRFGDQEPESGAEPTRADSVRWAFNSPFWPFVLATTSVGQEGLDFHPYCHAVVHWNLPSNPVDLEQREGRVHRYKGHALRKNIAARFASAVRPDAQDPWAAMFAAARSSRPPGENDLYPYWIAPDGDAKIERYVPALPHSREVIQKANLGRSLVLYRMVFGQNRQEDLVEYLARHLPPDQAERAMELCRIDLSPPTRSVSGSGADLFVKPDTWGLRGDPFLWDELESHFQSAGLPATWPDLLQQIEQKFLQLTGAALRSETPVFVERFDHGGVSSGQVDPNWWRTIGIPLLNRRFTENPTTLAPQAGREGEFQSP